MIRRLWVLRLVVGALVPLRRLQRSSHVLLLTRETPCVAENIARLFEASDKSYTTPIICRQPHSKRSPVISLILTVCAHSNSSYRLRSDPMVVSIDMSKPVQTTGSLVSIKAPNHTTPIQSPQPRLSAWTKKDPLATSGFATDPVPTITTTAPNADSAATALKFRPLVFGTLSNAPTTPNPAILTTAHAAAARSQPVRVNDTSLQRAQSRSREPSTLGPSAESKDSVTMPRSILASQSKP